MDSNTLAIILGLITNGLTALIAQLSHNSGEILVGKKNLEKWETEKTALAPILHKAISEVTEKIPLPDKPKEEIICLFLLTPEVEEIVRQIYSTHLLGKKDRSDLKLIRELFRASFSFFLSYEESNDLQEKQLADLANYLFDGLIKGCSIALNNAIDSGKLAAHEANSAFRHHTLLDELSTIQKKIDFLTTQTKPNIEMIDAFEKKYRQQVSNRHKDIIPPYLDMVRKLPINRIYVSPFIARLSNKNEETEEIGITDFLSGISHAVLLGNPGAGKSTLTLKLCYDLSTYYARQICAGRKHITPILIVLREYGAEKKIHNCSILQFIETKSTANYQVQPPPGAFEYLLLSGRILVLFDGLDELLDTTYRQEISSDVESFCNLYPSIPVIVTSREIGYDQAPLDEKRFEGFRISPFRDTQVDDFAHKWFNLVDKELTTDERKKRAEGFLNESTLASDLCSNPLMLALICNIYRGENYIPRNTPEVYEKCAIMLFERWDRSRGINVTLPFDWHIRPLLEFLAFWIFTDQKLRGGVTEEELQMKAKEYIYEWIFDDFHRAEKAAEEFVKFCTGRAWVFTDTGTTKKGEKLYQFTHTTFLEYFTASYLVRVYRTPKALINLLQSRVMKEEWDVMAQLAFQLQNKKTEGAGDELLTALIQRSQRIIGEKGWNLLFFAVRSLEFIVPRPKVTRNIIKTCIERLQADINHWINESALPDKKNEFRLSSKQKEVFAKMDEVALENVIVVMSYVKESILKIIKDSSYVEALAFLEICLFKLSSLNEDIFDNCGGRLITFYPKCFWLCYQAVYQRKLSIGELIKWYGIEGIFRQQINSLITRVSLSQLLLVRSLSIGFFDPEVENNWFVGYLEILEEVSSSIFPSNSLPWILISSTSRDLDILSTFGIYKKSASDKKVLEYTKITSDASFGVFILLIILLETNEYSFPQRLKRILKEIGEDSRTVNLPHLVLLARYQNVPVKRIQEELDKCGFNNEQQIFVWKWINKEINTVNIQNDLSKNKLKILLDYD